MILADFYKLFGRANYDVSQPVLMSIKSGKNTIEFWLSPPGPDKLKPSYRPNAFVWNIDNLWLTFSYRP